MSFGDILPIIIVLCCAGSKYIMALGFIVYYDYNFIESFVLAVTGGMLGIWFFSYFNDVFKKIWQHFFPKKDTGKIVINTKKRLIVKIRQSYGLAGIAFLTPVILTVPVGAIIATTLYKNKIKVYSYMLAAFIFWSLLFCGLYHLLDLDLSSWLHF